MSSDRLKQSCAGSEGCRYAKLDGGKLERLAPSLDQDAHFYFDFAFCAAQRRRCASAILLRASGLSTRRAFPFTFGLAAVLDAFGPLSFGVTAPLLASNERI